ncbi:cell wall-associated NlpC family hydrolase [Ruminiclostridium sufflavum DSM 19573]|uniref:Cell wall-associated NlpC family hydrolase n=1 Tax=Ruminiclostridium sufflavum DSM 19573 TaxID=1121337 RepID=A0A318XJL4_9FIRM|nr:C40 family peptidase [Ruminiclostridium sufflavum]PYG87414.1 cell wall-associated NlpC family hydrolase [Ruminiclostridium sufflavum DSM 19573]
MLGKINKILVACIFAFSLVLVCSVAMAASQSGQIVGTNVNMRTAPDTSSNVIKKISNSKVSILDKSSGWYKISFEGDTGWVNGDYIKALSTAGTINANGVNFRAGASTESKIIDTLNNGKNVVILDTQAGWHKVKVDSEEGYVSAQFVTASSASAKSSRSTTAVTVTESDSFSEVIEYAKKYVGVRYVSGGKSPKGFDCSGFVGFVYKHFGVSLNSSSSGMYSNGTKVSKSALKAGDILFFDASSRGKAGSIDHVGIYMGGDKFIHASSTNNQVIIQKLSEYQGTYIGAKRVM